MIAEWLMERHGWNAVWFLGSNGLRRGLLRFIGPATCYVGVWTGPALDLLCVKECETNQDAEMWLSPPGWTILHAAVLAWLKFNACARRNCESLCGSPNTESRNSIKSQEGWSCDG